MQIINSKKRILHIEQNTDGTIGGSHFSLLFLVEGIDKKYYETIVVFYQNNYLINRYKKANCKVIMMKKAKAFNIYKIFPTLKILQSNMLSNVLIVVPLKMIQKAINYIITFVIPAIECISVIKKENVDLVHLNNTILRPQEWILASFLTRTHIISHERGMNRRFSIQERYWASHLNKIICISDAVKKNLENNGFPSNKLIRIYNGLDPYKYAVSKNSTDIFEEFEIKKNGHVVGIVGNIREWKGQAVVINAIKLVVKIYPEIICFIVGDVSDDDIDYMRYIKNLVKINKIEKNIIITGKRHDVPAFINSFNILIHASLEPEPFGRVLLEGMALKKPVISTKIGAPLEIVIDGKSGILVTPGSHDELANAIIEILSDQNRAKEMGKKGYDRLVNFFHIRKNIELTETVYRELLGY